MKLWVSKNSEVPVRDQIVTQVTLGIASGDLAPGMRLPSTRELARRFGIHQNTVSAAYRELAEKRMVEFRKGSGVFISAARQNGDRSDLDQLFSNFLDTARSAGHSTEEIRVRLRKALEVRPASGFLLIESDMSLRDILLAEIRAATGDEVEGIAFEEFFKAPDLHRRRMTAMFDEEEKLRPLLSPGMSCVFLRANSVTTSLSGNKRPQLNELIAIVSQWEKFISLAKLYLLAAKVDHEMFISRLTTERNWRKGTDQAALIICDFLTANEFPNDERVRVFPLIAEASLEELRRSDPL